MAIIIKWSDEAIETFDNNINYLIEEWSDNEIVKFIAQTSEKIKSIESNPKLYRRSEKNPSIRKTLVNKHIALYYQYLPAKNEVTLLSFWNNRQNPQKLKY